MWSGVLPFPANLVQQSPWDDRNSSNWFVVSIGEEVRQKGVRTRFRIPKAGKLMRFQTAISADRHLD
jgi:hypothetical protein